MNSYLADIDKQAQDMFLRLVKQMAEREQMEWVQKMNNIQVCAIEVVEKESIYA